MKRALFVAAIVAACSVGWVGRSVFSEDAAPKGGDDLQALMMKLAVPGEQHERLKALAGEWSVKGKFTDKKSGKTFESESTSSMKSVFDGRFLLQDVTGSMMGMPFGGHSIMGFDNATQKYVSAWIDSMGTGILVSTGEETEKGKAWMFKGVYDLGGGRKLWSRLSIRLVSDKESVWQMWMSEKEGDEGDSMILNATRK